MARAAKGARAAKIKVYRTAIGFHDAYVAAPSRKAALAAWGADADLFARGVAEVVTDEALMAEPLATPGAVVKRSRGTAAEHLAALPPDPPRPAPARAAAGGAPSGARTRRPSPKPRPDRAALDAAEEALETARRQFDDAFDDLRRREAALREERQDAERRRDAEIARLDTAAGKARQRYQAAMRAWRA